MTGYGGEPITLPDHVWQRDETAALLRARDIGALFRLARKYGISQTRLATACALTQGKVSEIMKGTKHVIGLDVFERVADGLNLPDAARLSLGLAPRPVDHWRDDMGHPRTSEVVSAREGYPTPPRGTPDEPEMMVWVTTLTGEHLQAMIDRRAFMASMAALPAVGWLTDEHTMPRLTPTSEGADLGDIVQSMGELRTALVAQDNVLGSRTVAPTALHQVKILQELSDGATGRARESVMYLQAAYAEFAGWLADDLGDPAAGQYWIDRALEWAHQGADDLIVGYILARKAQRAAETGNSSTAIGLAQAAQRTGGLTARVHAAAAQYEAHGHAIAGDSAAFRTTIDRAHDLLTKATDTPTHGEWAGWCTPAYLTMNEAAGRRLLGEPANAAAVYEQALATWPAEMQREEGIYYGRLAEAHAKAGHPDRAVSAGQIALDIAARTASARIISELRPLSDSLTASDTAARSFLHDLNGHLEHGRGLA